MSDSRKQKNNLEILIRSRYPIIYVVSYEEKRVLGALSEIARRLGKNIYCWSCLSGLVQNGPPSQTQKKPVNAASRDPIAALKEAMDFKDPALFVFKDFHP